MFQPITQLRIERVRLYLTLKSSWMKLGLFSGHTKESFWVGTHFGIVVAPMSSKIALFLILFSTLSASARDSAENWLEIRSPHFVVLTNSSEKQARHIADQFERMRSVFRTLFPKASVDSASPVVVIALKNKKDFQALEPEVYLAKGQLNVAGLFLRTPDKNYILLRMDALGEHPFAMAYHEYTHSMLSKDEEWMPLWLNEGMAEFFQNTEIHGTDVQLGEPSTEDILYLRQNHLLPLEVLLKVDASSPYYHEEQKGSVFYAESWALVHYLQITDNQAHTHHLADYADLMSKHQDSVVAAEHAFGDLKQLQKALEAYVGQASFQYFKMSAATELDEAAYKVKTVSASEANAVQANFLSYTERTKDARALLDTVLRDDPNNVLAHETMGYLEFRQGNMKAAQKWYEQAVKLDSQSYLAHYYYAVMTMRSEGPSHMADAEAGLRTAIKLNPTFAPAYDQLAALYAMQHVKLDQAHTLNLQASQLEPGNLMFRLNAANVLVEAERYQDAVRTLQAALSLAKNPGEVADVQRRIKEIKEYQEEGDQATQPADALVGKSGTVGGVVIKSTAPKHPTEAPRGPKHVAMGVITNVHCEAPAIIELKIEDGGKSISLYSNDYFKIDFATTNYAPKDEINPCTDLNGMKARIQYSETSDNSIDGQILSVELSK